MIRGCVGLAVLLAVLTLTGCDTGRFDTNSVAAHTAVDVAQAREQLAGLTVQPAGSMAGYSRSLFPHWSAVEGACDTRETVLKKQGVGVRVDRECRATAGSWLSPYDGAVWIRASDIDVDHLIPLAAAWRSGASAWTVAERKLFANDLRSPQLIAVTDDVNQAKGDKSPDAWRPPLRTYWCQYATDWIAVKGEWQLTATSTEVGALNDMLDTCEGGA